MKKLKIRWDIQNRINRTKKVYDNKVSNNFLSASSISLL